MTIKDIKITDYNYSDNEISVKFEGKINNSSDFIIGLINLIKLYAEDKGE